LFPAADNGYVNVQQESEYERKRRGTMMRRGSRGEGGGGGGAEVCCVMMARPISVQLDNRDLWRQFYLLGTEMVITRTGRSAGLFLGI